MNAYVYQAALLCDDCAHKVMGDLKAQGKAPKNPRDEHSFDSDDYPKGPYPDGGGEADSPQHCDHCEKFLENPLTGDGERYVHAAVNDFDQHGRGRRDIIDQWKSYYDYLKFDPVDESFTTKLDKKLKEQFGCSKCSNTCRCRLIRACQPDCPECEFECPCRKGATTTEAVIKEQGGPDDPDYCPTFDDCVCGHMKVDHAGDGCTKCDNCQGYRHWQDSASGRAARGWNESKGSKLNDQIVLSGAAALIADEGRRQGEARQSKTDRRAAWMADYEQAVLGAGLYTDGRKPQDFWDTATYHFNSGLDAKAAAAKYVANHSKNEEKEPKCKQCGRANNQAALDEKCSTCRKGNYHRSATQRPKVGEAQMTWWDVYLNGEEIDSVPYTSDMTADEVKRSLINHDGYDSRITVKKYRDVAAGATPVRVPRREAVEREIFDRLSPENREKFMALSEEKRQEVAKRLIEKGALPEFRDDETRGGIIKATTPDDTRVASLARQITAHIQAGDSAPTIVKAAKEAAPLGIKVDWTKVTNLAQSQLGQSGAAGTPNQTYAQKKATLDDVVRLINQNIPEGAMKEEDWKGNNASDECQVCGSPLDEFGKCPNIEAHNKGESKTLKVSASNFESEVAAKIEKLKGSSSSVSEAVVNEGEPPFDPEKQEKVKCADCGKTTIILPKGATKGTQGAVCSRCAGAKRKGEAERGFEIAAKVLDPDSKNNTVKCRDCGHSYDKSKGGKWTKAGECPKCGWPAHNNESRVETHGETRGLMERLLKSEPPTRRKLNERRGEPCMCSDPGCPVGHGSKDCGKPSSMTLYRVDMEDNTGTSMCAACGEDAMDAGVFRAGR